MKLALNRRRFLGAFGLTAGAGLLSPLLRQVWADESGAVARRVVIVMTGNGIEGHTLLSQDAQAARDGVGSAPVEVSTGDLATAPALGALAAGGADLTSRAAVVYGLSNKIAGGGHTAQYKALSASQERRQTIDAWLAERLHGDEPFAALRMGTMESAAAKLQYGICLQSAGQQLPIIANPADAHAAMFGAIASGAGGRAFSVQADLLDFAAQDVQRVQREFVGSARERAKLESYLLALEELREQQRRLVGMGDALRDLADGQGLDPETGEALNVSHPLERLHGQFRLAAAALVGGLTNVVLLTNSVGNAFSHTKYTSLRSIFEQDPNFSGDVPWRHGVCHEAGGNPVYQRVLDRVIARQVEMIAELARKLDAVPEGDGTMLDHTTIVFMSDNGSSHHSQSTNWPTLLVGGGAMGLATGGRTWLYPGYGSDANPRVSNLFNTLGYVAGAPVDDFGGEPDRAERGGPLSELLG
jgi:hypothetical protein